MQHFSCDQCGRELFPPADARYSLKMEARLICEEVELTEADLDGQESLDPVDAMEDWLSTADDTLDDAAALPLAVAPLDRAYDLCGPCYRRFRADPLGKDRVRNLQFSDN